MPTEFNDTLKRLVEKGEVEIDETNTRVRLTEKGLARITREKYGVLADDVIEPPAYTGRVFDL